MTSSLSLTEVYEQTLRHLLGPVKEYLEDPSVSEVMINGADEIYVERQGKLQRADTAFEDADALSAAMRNVAQFVGKRLDADNPSIEARLPDGSRVHIVQAPAARKGLCATIRKFSEKKIGLDDLVAYGTVSAKAAEFLGISVSLAKNIIVSGGTGSGKTTLLNCLSGMIPEDERIIVLEDSSELQLQQSHVVPFEAQAPDRHGRGGIGIRELLRASLRMRPDRIIVGECRGGEALDMIQAMTSGHSGSLSTCHANNPRDALNRLETMSLMAGVEIPLFALRAQVASAIDLIVQIARFHDGARRITQVTEVLGISDTGSTETVDLYRYDSAAVGPGDSRGVLASTGTRPTFWNEPHLMALDERIELTRDMWKQGDDDEQKR